MDIKKILTEKNVGKKDKHIRLSVGALFFAGGVFSSSTILGIVGLLILITGIRENCTVYSLMDKNTCEKKK